MTTTDTTTDPTTPEPGAGAEPRRSIRPLLLRLHFYAGLLVGPFILVAAVSGMLYAATPQLEKAVYDHELTTDARGPLLSIDEQIAIAREVEPDLPLAAVRPAPEEGDTTQVLFDAGRAAESYREAVFVDPVEGDVHGRLTVYGTTGALPLRTWVDDLHRNLHLGVVGRFYSELAASWLWVIALAGLALWWTGPRRTRSRLRPSREGGRRRRLLSWHGAVGTWLVVGMLMLSATGLTWSRFAGANVTDLRAALDWSTPAVVADLSTGATSGGDHAGHEGHEGHEAGHEGHEHSHAMPTALGADSPGVGFQGAYDAALGEGLTAAKEITPPAGETGTYVVTEVQRAWPTSVDAASVAPDSGEVVDVVRFDDYPFMAKLARWGVDVHMGTLFGLPNQVALILLAGGVAAMVVWGYRMWWLRRPTRGGWPRPPLRGAWRDLPPVATTVLVVAAVGLAWFLPVFGVSLVAFLLLDLAVGAYARRSQTRS